MIAFDGNVTDDSGSSKILRRDVVQKMRDVEQRKRCRTERCT